MSNPYGRPPGQLGGNVNNYMMYGGNTGGQSGQQANAQHSQQGTDIHNFSLYEKNVGCAVIM